MSVIDILAEVIRILTFQPSSREHCKSGAEASSTGHGTRERDGRRPASIRPTGGKGT
jgi:hypothetical protein